MTFRSTQHPVRYTIPLSWQLNETVLACRSGMMFLLFFNASQPLLYLKCPHRLQVSYEESLANFQYVGHEPKRGQAAPGAAAAFLVATPIFFLANLM